jgi:integrase
MLLQGGTEIQTVAERLGHAQASTTLNTYAHVLEGRDRKAAEVFDGMVNDACT